MQCQNPVCLGEKEFEHTAQERELFTEMDVDPDSVVFCRQCREMRKLAFRNERTLFKRKCNQTGKEMWSTYDATSPFTVFDKNVWWSDSWDGLQYGRFFDSNRPFFQQFFELMLKVPRPALIQMKNQNSDYTNDANRNNDCYQIFTSDDNVNCHYGSYIECKDCRDSEELFQCELCADSLYCHTCNTAVGSEYCMNCSSVYFSSNCVNCHNCIFCFGLRDRRNCIFNSEVSPDVFMNFIMQRQLFRRKNYKKSQEMFRMYLETVPQRYMFLLKTENSTGDRLLNCKDCENSYSSENCVRCSNVAASAMDLRDCIDCWSASYGAQKCIENQTCLRGGFNFVGNFCNDCVNCYYIDNCQSCQHCFGCTGLKHKKYCILNKEYSKEEYEKLLVPKIIEHMKKTKEWGQFFPFWSSPYAYNTTVANLYYPLDTKQYFSLLQMSQQLWPPGENTTKNHLWSMQIADGRKKPEKINTPPDSLFEKKNDEILQEIYHDPKTYEPFRITGRELALCQTLKLPLPEKAFTTRYRERFIRYNPRTLNKRNCQRCKKVFQTNFPSDSPYIVFCEECFQSSLQ